jgi:hypothetical protein
MLKPDINLLCSVLQNQCKSYDDRGQFDFALWIIKTLGKIDNNFNWEFDKIGNLYIIKGESEFYPCMVAHLDTVHEHVDNFIIKRVGDFIIGFDNDCGTQVGCGADDRCGIALSIEMFRQHPNIKLFFPVDEEVGGIGSNNCNIEFFENCCFMIQPDRNMYNNKKDYINFTNGVETTTKEFDEEIQPFLDRWGYTKGYGTFTDIGELISNGANICAFNLSCYLGAHSDQEVVFIPLYEDALNLINEVILNMSDKQWILPETFKHNFQYNYNNWTNDWGWDDIPVNDYFDEDYLDEDYFEQVVDEIQACKRFCNGDFVEEQIDGTYFCNECKKTLGENIAIQKNINKLNF